MRRAVLVLVCLPACASDWLIQPPRTATALQADPQRHELSLSNGLIRRVWRISPNAATVALDQLPLQKSLLRGVKPEAVVEIDGARYEVGGLIGQPEYAYFRREWLDKMTAARGAFRFVRHESGPAGTPLEWKRGRYAPAALWPPKGVRLTLHFDSPALPGVAIAVCYEMFDGLPVLAKWISLKNGTQQPLRLNRFTSEVLAVVESESNVEGIPPPPDSLYVETEYAFHGMDPRTSNRAVHWVEDPQYSTQVNYARKTPAQLEVRPPIGPDALIEPGASFNSFRVFELVYDSTDRERNGLARRRMYRTLVPWTQENPILMHVRKSDPASVRAAVDQCADAGFEMVILSFGSGFDMEREDPAYLGEIRSLVGYARS